MADRSVRYPQELRERAVRRVAESRPDHATEWEAMRSAPGRPAEAGRRRSFNPETPATPTTRRSS